jgi:glycosyltransferase involved in cell wall biosynthesis
MTLVGNQPRVSIGLPVYNGERYVSLAIDSLLAQTFGNFELIISDNASTDDTERICRAYAGRDTRIRYVRQRTNVGANKNFNLLVEYATAPYFKWASADDLVAPDFLERCLSVIEQDPKIVLVHSRTKYIGAEGEELTRIDPGLHLMQDAPSDRLFALWSVLTYCNAQYGIMRLDALRRTPLFGNFVASDISFLAEFALQGKFCEIPAQLLMRRLHEDAASNLNPQQLREHYGLRRNQLSLHYWRHFLEDVRLIWRAPIESTEKRRAMAMVVQRMVWQRAVLVQELGFLLRHFAGRPYPLFGSIHGAGRHGPGATG